MSVTDHGPANDDDLGRALHDLAHDPSLPGLDTHLDVVRGRTRRRRAAKKVALGATTLCVAGALGLAVTSLPQTVHPAPVPPAESPSPSPSPTPTPSPAPSEVVEPLDGRFEPACGEDLTELRATTTPLTLGPAGEGSAGAFDVVNTGDVHRTVASTGYVALYLLDDDGRVISTPSMNEPLLVLDLDPSGAGAVAPAGIGGCNDGEPPAAGTYSALGLLTAEITTSDDTAQDTIVGGPWEITIDDTGMLTSIAGRPLDNAPDQTTTPPTEPETPAAPVVVRDVLGRNDPSSDTSVIFEALRQSASDGSPAEVDIVVEDTVPVPRWTVEPDGARTLTVEPNGQLPYRDRTTSDDGWSMTVRGGFFEPTLHPDTLGYVFTRFVGTYSVSLDDTRGVPHFELQVLEGGTPVSPPPTTDPAVCAAWNESLTAGHGVYTDYTADASSLWSSTSARSDFEGYQAIKARWIDSPMVWWAMISRGEDAIVSVCTDWWE